MRCILGFLLVFAVAAPGCGDGAEGGGSDELVDAAVDASQPQDDGGGSQYLNLITYNVGLAVVVKGAEERKSLVIDALAGCGADVVCLQEVFAPVTSSAEMAEALASTYPYSWSSDSGDSVAGSGLLILSRHPLEAEAELVFVDKDPLGLTDRMAIATDVRAGVDRIHVICTHLNSGLDAGNTEVRLKQVDEIIEWSHDQGYLDGPTFLLGDFNLGPDPIGACTAASDPPCLAPDEATYAYLIETFDDPNRNWKQCTQCREVFLPMQVIDLYADEPDQRLDHCFVKNIEPLAHAFSEIVFDENLSIEIDGDTIPSLSDHLGIRCVFE